MRYGYRKWVAGALMAGAALATASSAQATGFDDTFGSTGTVFSPVSPLGDRYYNTTRAPGGGTYNVGYTTVAGTDRAFLLTRVDANGELVPGFGTGGVTFVNVVTGPYAASPSGATPTGTGEIARGVVVQSDGNIVVTGQAETPPSAGKPDSRDIDVYAARFNTNGTLDATFGTGGVKRIDLSNGVGAANTLNGDQSYGTVIRPDGKIAIVASKGLDSTEPTRTDRDIAIVQLLSNGDLDTTFGTGGIASTRNAGVSENPRQGLLQADGKIVSTSYGNLTGSPVRPWIYRFNANGTTDTTFGTAGVASGDVGGPSPGYAESYDLVQQGDSYVLTGYGSRSTTPANGVDLVLYRFSAAGVWDRTFGDDGLFTYNRVNGADRARDLTSLPDGRLVPAGSTANAANTDVDGLVLVVKADGTAVENVFQNDLGGLADSYYGTTTVANGTKVVVAGYRGATPSDSDESVLSRFDLPPAVAGPVGPAGPKGDTGASLQAAPGAAGPAGPAGPAGKAGAAAGKITVSCKLTGKKKNKVSCTTKQAKSKVSLRLVKAGKTVARGSGAKTVALRGKVRAGRYTLVATSGKTQVAFKVTLR